MTNEIFMGIDLGTSSVKVILIRGNGECLAQTQQEYAISCPFPGWAEQEPEEWVGQTIEAVRDVCAKFPKITAIGFSGQMHGAVFLDYGGKPLRPAIIWADQRSKCEVDAFIQHHGIQRLAKWTGNQIFPGLMLATLLWLKRQEPQVLKKTSHLLLPKDYLRFRLGGNFHSDSSDACSTGLFDVIHRAWSDEMIDVVGLDRQWLAEVIPSTGICGYLNKEMAQVIGLTAGIPLICGGGDQACQAVGNGILKPENMSITIGTGGQVFLPLKSHFVEPDLRFHLFCHALPETWYVLAATLSAGLSLRWLKELFDPVPGFDELVDAALLVPPGSEGLTFLPYLAGERTPLMNANARGVFAGLTLRHGRQHLARAVLEGVLFSLKQGIDILEQKGFLAKRVVAAGGVLKNPLMRQMLADVMGKEIYWSLQEEAAAFGAALLSAAGVGYYPSIEDACRECVQILDDPMRPSLDAAGRYQRAYQTYSSLYPALNQFMG